MSFFYAQRNDKNGNLLLTSYGNLKSAEKYGGADADITETLHHAEFSESMTRLKIAPDVKGDVVRSYMKNGNAPSEQESGRYVLFGKINGQWERTSFSFGSYGTANTMMKALINAYQAMVVLDVGAEAPQERVESQTFDMSSL